MIWRKAHTNICTRKKGSSKFCLAHVCVSISAALYRSASSKPRHTLVFLLEKIIGSLDSVRFVSRLFSTTHSSTQTQLLITLQLSSFRERFLERNSGESICIECKELPQSIVTILGREVLEIVGSGN